MIAKIKRGKNIRSLFMRSEIGLFLVLLVMVIIASFLSPNFLTAQNIFNVLRQTSIIGVVSLGMLLVIITSGIDLSVGSMVGLSGAIFAISYVWWGLPPFIALFLAILTGVSLGFINGVILTKLKMPHPFISTLGMMNIARGLALVAMKQTPISGMPSFATKLGQGQLGPIPISVIFLLILYIIFHFLLTRTVLGRHIFAVGGNVEAALISGVNVDRILIIVYTISGFTCALGALLLAGRVNATYPLAGLGYELDAIAAVIIGGASFFGGVGNVSSTLAGVLIIGVLRNILNLMAVESNWQLVAIGMIIILAVYLDVIRRKISSRGTL